ncbi:MAG TPA: hypothetical protein VE645_14965 [Pseudonocardiaceae bacterium]|nr:hypothetical protein [Pseudonocardiaceae bacterium]
MVIITFQLPFVGLKCHVSSPLDTAIREFEPYLHRQKAGRYFPDSSGTGGHVAWGRNKHCIRLKNADKPVEIAGAERLLKYSL